MPIDPASPAYRIRVATPMDAPALAALKAPWVEETPYNFAYEPPTAEEFALEVSATLERYPFLVAEEVDEPADPDEPGATAVERAATDDANPIGATGTGTPSAPRPRILGYVQAEPFRSREADAWNVELTIYLARDARGRGVGGALYRELLRLLALQGVQNTYACVTASNAASLAFHERLGFTEVGRFPATGYKLGSWHGTVYLWKALGDHACPPTPFVPFPRLKA